MPHKYNPDEPESYGVGSLMMLRAAHMNGVDVKHPRQQEQQIHGYARRPKEAQQQVLQGPFDWSIFETKQYSFNQDSGTQHLIKMTGQGGHRMAP